MPPTPLYLDQSATSPLLPSVKSAMLSAMDMHLGNSSALHTPGHQAHQLIEQARLEIARLIHAHSSEIIFTSGGTETNNTIIHTFQSQNVATSNIEHPSILEPAKAYTNHLSLPVNREGYLEDLTLISAFTKKSQSPLLVSVMLANNEIGTIQPIAQLAQIAHAHKAYFHTDATQALGKIPINVKELGVDYLTISAHKIGGPTGIGALYVKDGYKSIKNLQKTGTKPTYSENSRPLRPLLLGGHQEHSLRAGTVPVVSIIGFAAAAEYIRAHNIPKVYHEKIRPLRNLLASRIISEIPHSSLNTPIRLPKRILSASSEMSSSLPAPTSAIQNPTASTYPPSSEPSQSLSAETLQTPTPPHPQKKPCHPTLPHLLNVSFQAAEGESIQLYLDTLAGIAVSTGSACASGDASPSHVLMATTGDAEVAHSSIRFSLPLDFTPADINYIMKFLPDVVSRLQSISTIKINP